MLSRKFQVQLKELINQSRDRVLDVVQIHIEGRSPKTWKIVRGRILSIFGHSGLEDKLADLINQENSVEHSDDQP